MLGMRFIENGPSIPLHLLEQQALGNVIFFCGAGVSVPAGLDTFWQLTDRVIRNLDSDRARKSLEGGVDLELIERLLSDKFGPRRGQQALGVLDTDQGRAAMGSSVEFDRIFAFLSKEFGRAEIDRQIFAALGQKKARTLAHHRNILRLSRSASGNIQVVTTNFDLLFERAQPKIRPIVPPSLPRLDLSEPIDGVVYLHGRLADKSVGEQARYVISSPDFGRAYLAEGWAARFVKELRERHTLVFLGYGADDPPMRYLLEGLNDRENVTYENPIYAFAPDHDGEAVEAWIDKGVKAIPYDPERRHEALWDTVEHWANAATDSAAWEAQVINLARQRPQALRPFERGMVAEFVSTKRGAKVFAEAMPSPSAEWLCVFDPSVRFGKPRKASYGDGAEEIEPQNVYGLDSDPPRPPSSSNSLYEEGALDPLSLGKGEEPSRDRVRLQGAHPIFNSRLPQRLHSLANWISTVCAEPTAIWWASGSGNSLNPHVLWAIANRLRTSREDVMPSQASKFWSLYLETAEARSFADKEYPWHDFEGLVSNVGWSPSALRYFEDIARPFVAASRPLGGPLAPEGSWEDLNLRQVSSLEVKAAEYHDFRFEIPPEQLPRLLRILAVSIERMLELLDEIGDTFWRAPNLHPSDKPGERYHGENEQLVLWLCELFRKLVDHDSPAAIDAMNRWPTEEARVFAKLRIWAASLDSFLSDAEAFNEVASLSQDVFWQDSGQRGILLLLKVRWTNFDDAQRQALEGKILDGPLKWDGEKDEQFTKRRARNISTRLRWLQLNACELSEDTQQSLAEFKLVDAQWNDDYVRGADESFSPRGGWIAENKETKGLEELPVNEILAAAENSTEERFDELTHFKPFRGLVEQHPFMALSALRRAIRDDEFPAQFWIDLMSNWPEGTSLRLRWLAAASISNLTDERALELRYYSSDWLKKHLAAFYSTSRPKALEIFDGFLRPFKNAAVAETESSIGDSTIGGVVQIESQVSINKAINSPIGQLTEALWSVTANKGKPIGRLNGKLASRFEKLSQVPGHGGGHSIAVLAMHLGWIDYRYEDWSREFLLPKFHLDNPLSEAAWHGYLYNRNRLSREVFEALHDDWLAILEGNAPWEMNLQGKRVLISTMVWLTNPEREGGALFSFAEVKAILKETDAESRSHAIWALGDVFPEHGSWQDFVKPFIEQAWPRQLRYKSRQATRNFLRIAENAGENFPEVVKTIKPLLRPVQDGDMFTYRIYRDPKKDGKEASSFASGYPKETLELLDAITGDDRVLLPYGFSDALKALVGFDPTLQETPEYQRLSQLID